MRDRVLNPRRAPGSMFLATLPAVVLLPVLLLGGCGKPPQPTINLYRAIHTGDLDQIKRHLYWGTDINQADPQGEKPLHVAARRGRLIIARQLLQHGADPNARNRGGETPLHIALAEGRTELADALIEAGAADDIQDLLFALVRAGVDDRDTLDLLIGKGANIDAVDESGLTPLQIAVDHGQRLLTKRLIDLGADVNSPGDGGRTPLAIAIEKGDRDIIDLLERFGARAEPPQSAH